jgi:hypothetical protein
VKEDSPDPATAGGRETLEYAECRRLSEYDTEICDQPGSPAGITRPHHASRYRHRWHQGRKAFREYKVREMSPRDELDRSGLVDLTDAQAIATRPS